MVKKKEAKIATQYSKIYQTLRPTVKARMMAVMVMRPVAPRRALNFLSAITWSKECWSCSSHITFNGRMSAVLGASCCMAFKIEAKSMRYFSAPRVTVSDSLTFFCAIATSLTNVTFCGLRFFTQVSDLEFKPFEHTL